MMRGIWTRETVALMLVAAAVPVAAAWIWEEGVTGLTRLLLTALIGGFWQAIFTIVRAQPPSVTGGISALAIAMLAPEAGPFQFALGVSFGFIFGELVYGGWGRSVLNPAVVAIMFIAFSFPTAAWPQVPVQVGWAVVPAALLLLGLGIIQWRVMLGAVGVLFFLGGFGLDLLTSATVFVLIFLVCDPATSASTRWSRWAYGVLFGALVGLFASLWDASSVQIAISAALLAMLTAPLLDELSLALWRVTVRYRHG